MMYHFTDPINLVKFFFQPPQNTWGCAVTLKNTRDKCQNWANRSWLRPAIFWQNVRDATSWSPTALIWIIWLIAQFSQVSIFWTHLWHSSHFFFAEKSSADCAAHLRHHFQPSRAHPFFQFDFPSFNFC